MPNHPSLRAQPDRDGGDAPRAPGNGVPAVALAPRNDPLEAERDLLAAIVDKAPIGILITDPSNRAVVCERAVDRSHRS